MWGERETDATDDQDMKHDIDLGISRMRSKGICEFCRPSVDGLVRGVRCSILVYYPAPAICSD